MKKLILFSCLLICALNMHARAVRDEANLVDETAKVSYSFGMMIGSELASSGMEIDYARFAEGLRDTMEGRELKLSDEEAREIIQSSFVAAQTRRNEENKIKEDLFLAENGTRDGVIRTASGLQYEVLTEGAGPKPSVGDTVKVHYEGKLTDGTEFDSSYSRGEPAELPVDGLIDGWSEGLQLMNSGSKYRLYIPSALGYGAQGAGGVIPPYSTLIFTVELLEVTAPGSETDASEGEAQE